MDMEEAKRLIKGLQATGREAEQHKRAKEREAKACRVKATKKALIAMSEMSESPPSSPSDAYATAYPARGSIRRRAVPLTGSRGSASASSLTGGARQRA